MSSDPHDAPQGAGPHDEHAFTGEPVDALPADETPTPTWVPLLGVVLFTSAAVFVIAGRANAGAAPAASETAVAATAPPPASPPPAPSGLAAQPRRPITAPAAPAAATPSGTPTVTGDKVDVVRKRQPRRPPAP